MIAIRTASAKDLEQLSGLFNRYRIFYRKEPDLDGAKAFLQERMQKDESIIYVAEENGELLGFTQLYPLFSSTRMKRIWLLNDLFVLESCRGRGISKSLIEAGKELARNTNAAGLSLETEKTNAIGNQLYPRCGFVLNEKSNFYWWTNEPS